MYLPPTATHTAYRDTRGPGLGDPELLVPVILVHPLLRALSVGRSGARASRSPVTARSRGELTAIEQAVCRVSVRDGS